jgi:N-glycosylase/DNA lyase
MYMQDQTGSIPVDTHVWQIALRDYDPLFTLRNAKSLTPMVYEQVGTVFRDRLVSL